MWWASDGHTKRVAVHDKGSKIHSLATGGSFAGVEATLQEAGNEKAFMAFRLFLSFCLVVVPSLHFRPVDLLGSSPKTAGV